MKIAIMQPYLFPYIGYWQLINMVDEFVILDDVNYIKRGYINRNNILLDGEKYMFSLPVQKASQNKLIMETKIMNDTKEKQKLIHTFQNAYRRCRYYENVMPVIENIIANDEDDLTDYIKYSIDMIMQYLNIKTIIKKSSMIDKNNSLKGQDRIIEICKKERADCYIYPSGGRDLYDSISFKKNDIQLFFLEPKINQIEYKQKSEKFIAYLSIIDVMMNLSIEEIGKIMLLYELKVE